MNKHERYLMIKYVLDERCLPVKTDDLAKQYFNDFIEHLKATEKELEEIKQKNKDLQNALTISYDIERQTFQDNLLMKETVEHESDILEYLKDVMDVLESLQNRLIDDYNCNEPFNQMEEDRIVIGNILDLLYDKGL